MWRDPCGAHRVRVWVGAGGGCLMSTEAIMDPRTTMGPLLTRCARNFHRKPNRVQKKKAVMIVFNTPASKLTRDHANP